MRALFISLLMVLGGCASSYTYTNQDDCPPGIQSKHAILQSCFGPWQAGHFSDSTGHHYRVGLALNPSRPSSDSIWSEIHYIGRIQQDSIKIGFMAQFQPGRTITIRARCAGHPGALARNMGLTDRALYEPIGFVQVITMTEAGCQPGMRPYIQIQVIEPPGKRYFWGFVLGPVD